MKDESGNCVPCSAAEGYTLPFFKKDGIGYCTEICGDGLNLGQYECDDGNKNDGDGCSK